MSEAIANILTKEPLIIKGVKVWGIKVPFSLTPLRVDVIIKLAGIGKRIVEKEGGGYDLDVHIPNMIEYVATALNNKRWKVLYWLLKKELGSLQQAELLLVYQQAKAMWNPFFFTHLLTEMKKMGTLLVEEEKQSGEGSV